MRDRKLFVINTVVSRLWEFSWFGKKDKQWGNCQQSGIDKSSINFKPPFPNFLKECPPSPRFLVLLFLTQMPSCEPPFVPVLLLSWQKLSSLRSGKEEQSVITGCEHKHSFPHPAKHQAAGNSLYIFQGFVISSQSSIAFLQILLWLFTNCNQRWEKVAVTWVWEERCTDIIMKDVCDLAEETKFKGTGGGTSGRVHPCQQLCTRSIRTHSALPGIATAWFPDLQEIERLISEKGCTFAEQSN